jgi:hypothetical protein
MACRQKLEATTKAFKQAVSEATAAWRQAVAAAARPNADPEGADRALRQANRKWLVTVLDALEDYRSAGRSILRRYQLGIEEER